MTKKIEAIIRPEKLNDVKKALSEIGIVGMNILEVRGRGRGAGMELRWRTGRYKVEFLPYVQLNIVLSDANVAVTIDTIMKAAKSNGSGDKGDGVIFVLPVEDVIRISSGERGKDALHYQGDIDERKEKA